MYYYFELIIKKLFTKVFEFRLIIMFGVANTAQQNLHLLLKLTFNLTPIFGFINI